MPRRGGRIRAHGQNLYTSPGRVAADAHVRDPRRDPVSFVAGGRMQRAGDGTRCDLHLRARELLDPRPEHRLGSPPTSPSRTSTRAAVRWGRTAAPPPRARRIGPGQGWTFFQEDNPQLPAGYKGSAVVESDQPIVALQAKDVRRNGAFMVDGDTTTIRAGRARCTCRSSPTATARRTTGTAASRCRTSATPSTACVTLTYLSNNTDGEIAWDPYKPGAKNAPKQPGCPNGGRPDPAARHALPRSGHVRRTVELHRIGAH